MEGGQAIAWVLVCEEVGLIEKGDFMLPQLFNHEGQELRTIMNERCEPEFCAQDVCLILDVDPSQTRRLDEDEKGLRSIQTLGGVQEKLFLTESGLYTMVLGSRKPEARTFKRWITHEVIPSIRKTGSYSTQSLSPQLQLLINMELKQNEMQKAISEAKETQQLQAAAITDHEFKLSEIDQKVTDKITLTSLEQSQLQGAVASRVRKFASKPYAGLYSALKREFGVPSYRDIRKSDLSRAFRFINAWVPNH